MLTRLRHRAQGQEGFTLIELLVVILIIGILAAVAIPAFLNQKGKANDANVKSDINTAQTAEETYFTDGQTYTANTSDLTNIENTLQSALGSPESLVVATTTGGATLYGAADNGTGVTLSYNISANSPSGVQYALTKFSDGTVQRTCNVPNGKNASGCKLPSGSTTGNGSW